MDRLSPSEQKVLALVAQGMDNTAIAEFVGRDKREVDSCLMALSERLHLSSRVEMILWLFSDEQRKGKNGSERGAAA